MALLMKKPAFSEGPPMYTIGANKNVLIIGLGNPGKEYSGTRHNIGFEVLDLFAAKNDFPTWITKKDLKAEIAVNVLGETRVILCKPTSFVNNSGETAQAVQRFYRVYNPGTLVVYDELSVDFGSLRTRVGGTDAGHNGIKSLITHIGDDFNRLRIGTGSKVSKKADQAAYVLDKFSKKEQETVPLILREASAIITEFIFSSQLPHDTRTVL